MPLAGDPNMNAYGDPNMAAGMPLMPQKRMPRADVVMVFPYKTSALVRWGAAMEEEERFRGLKPPTDDERNRMETWEMKRQGVITALSDCGLVLLCYYSRDRDEIFVKIACEDHHLRQVAEMKRHKLELKEEYLSAFAEYKNDYPGQRELNYTDRVVVSHLYKAHIDTTDPEGFGEAYPRPGDIFRTADRVNLISYIVRQSDHNCAGVDVGQMMHDGDLQLFFPLHENRKLVEMDRDWFKCFVWGTEIQKVRDYFGERIAMYFLFMSHFIKWLIMPAIFGTALWVCGVFYGTPDNISALLVCAGVSFWAVFFVHFWRRNAATHSVKWGTLGMNKMLEPTRPEFIGSSRINPVTGRIDRYYPWSERIFKVIFSYSVLTVAIICLFFVISCLFYIRHVFHKHGGRIWFMVVNALVVEVLNSFFTYIAKILTNRENHRAYSDHAQHLLSKTIIFKFVNSYISLYYIAFFKEHSQLFGMPMACMYNERLQQNDCLRDLGWQVAIFITVRTSLLTVIELGLPYFLMWWRRVREGRTFHTGLFSNPLAVMPDMSSAEKQSKKEEFDVYEDMDEILILYGYCTLFVVACPWAPMLCLFSCILECFLDQKKLVLLYRRPMPEPAVTNEPWDTAFDVFSILAMLTNAAVYIFAGHSLDAWSHTSKVALFIAIEFATVFVRGLVGVILPSMPRRVKMLQLQQRVMVHRHINMGGEEDDHEIRASAMRTTAQPPPHVFDRDQEDDDMW
jgi:anoctamin-10/anoctamin-7